MASRPNRARSSRRANSYLDKKFPELSKIKAATILPTKARSFEDIAQETF